MAEPPMQICMLVYNQCHRDARVLKTAATLADAGHDVRIVAVGVGDDAPVEQRDGFRILRIWRRPVHVRVFDALKRATVLPGRHRQAAVDRTVVAAPPADPPRVGRAPAHDMLDVLGAMRTRAFGLLRAGMRRVHRPLMFADWWIRAARGVASHKVDVVHAHDVLTLPAAVAIAHATGARLIYDAHELYSEVSTLSPRERRTWSRIEAALAPRADGTLTVCDSIADELAARYRIRRPQVLLNCPEAPLDPIRPNARLRTLAGLPEGEPIVLYHGGLAPNRGIEELIEAFVDVPMGHLVILGWGRQEQALRDLVTAHGLGARVRFAPPVPREELLQVVAGADVGVIPYRAVGLNNYYTTPNKLFELINAGVPIAASRFPELERFVGGLELGELFDPDDVRDIARALTDLLADPQRRERARDNARRAAPEFSWERQAKVLLDLYDAPPPGRWT